MASQSTSQHSDASAVLRNATFSHGDGPAPSPDAVTSSDLLMGAYDPTKLHPMAGLEDKLDYLLLDDDKLTDLPGSGTAIPSRGWSDDLCYGTGTMYLSGTFRVSSCHLALISNRVPFRHLGSLALSLTDRPYCLSLITCPRFLCRSRPCRRMGTP